MLQKLFNPFSPNVPFLNHLKISKSQKFSDVLRGYGNGTLGENGLFKSVNNIKHTSNCPNYRDMYLLKVMQSGVYSTYQLLFVPMIFLPTFLNWPVIHFCTNKKNQI